MSCVFTGSAQGPIRPRAITWTVQRVTSPRVVPVLGAPTYRAQPGMRARTESPPASVHGTEMRWYASPATGAIAPPQTPVAAPV